MGDEDLFGEPIQPSATEANDTPASPQEPATIDAASADSPAHQPAVGYEPPAKRSALDIINEMIPESASGLVTEQQLRAILRAVIVS